MPLSDTKIKNAKPQEKPYKLTDGQGMYLLIQPSGGRWWRLKYRHNKIEKGLSLGIYPDVSLKRARELRDEARQLIARGIDPSAQRQAAKAVQGITLEKVAREWLELQEHKLAPVTMRKAKWMLETFIFPKLGNVPIGQLDAPALLAELRKVEARGLHETAHRTKQRVGQILRYAVATSRATRDVTQDLRGILAPVVTTNHAAIIEPNKVGALLRAIDGYSGQPATHAALKLAPLVFVRPGELRAAEWSEFDLDAAEWRIPGARTKMGTPHIVPLPSQAVAVLNELEPLTGECKFVFPSLRDLNRPMSENTINAALRRLGYSGDEMTGHGFRAMASTLLNEQGFAPDVIELQLAHIERNKVRAAYNRAERLAERRKMMQSWANHLDQLKAGGKLITMRGRR